MSFYKNKNKRIKAILSSSDEKTHSNNNISHNKGDKNLNKNKININKINLKNKIKTKLNNFNEEP